MKMNGFADAVKNKPKQTRSEFTPKGAEIPTGELLGILKPGTNQTQPVVSLSNLLQTNHPIFKISLKNPLFLNFFLFMFLFLSSAICPPFSLILHPRTTHGASRKTLFCPALLRLCLAGLRGYRFSVPAEPSGRLGQGSFSFRGPYKRP